MCPALRELEFTGRCYQEAGYRFPHLTRLEVWDFRRSRRGSDASGDEAEGDGEDDGDLSDGADDSEWRLSSVAPRLESLACRGRGAGLASAAEGHPALRELELDFSETHGMDEPDAGRWPGVCAKLPQLTSLVFKVVPGRDVAHKYGDYYHVDALEDTILELSECKQLAHLELSSYGFPEVRPGDLFDMVGNAVGDRLVSLSLAGGEPCDAGYGCCTGMLFEHTAAYLMYPEL